jgi:hypothetical protein
MICPMDGPTLTIGLLKKRDGLIDLADSQVG